MNEEILTAIKTLNDNVARLTAAQVAIADELHMIRRAVEGDVGAYDDPYANALKNFCIDLDADAPVLLC